MYFSSYLTFFTISKVIIDNYGCIDNQILLPMVLHCMHESSAKNIIFCIPSIQTKKDQVYKQKKPTTKKEKNNKQSVPSSEIVPCW